MVARSLIGVDLATSQDHRWFFPERHGILIFRAILPSGNLADTHQNTPKYWTWHDSGTIPTGNPTAQLDMTNVIPAEVTDADGNVIQGNYRTDGY